MSQSNLYFYLRLGRRGMPVLVVTQSPALGVHHADSCSSFMQQFSYSRYTQRFDRAISLYRWKYGNRPNPSKFDVTPLPLPPSGCWFGGPSPALILPLVVFDVIGCPQGHCVGGTLVSKALSNVLWSSTKARWIF